MKRTLTTLALAGLITACAVPAVEAVSRTKTKVISDWTGDDEGERVVEVNTPRGPVMCIQMKDKYGGGFNDDPKGVSVGISCDWTPK